MNKINILVLASIIIFGLVGCGIANREVLKEQSDLKRNYSMGSIVEAHQEFLLEGPRTLSGSETGPREPFVQSQEEMILQVNSENAIHLLEALQSDINEAITNGGATIVGSSGRDVEPDPIAHFSYSYSEGPFYGVINIWGLKGEGNTLLIISEITESKTPIE